MTDKDFKRLVEFRIVHNAMVPANENARELIEQNVGRTLAFQEKTNRDLKYHRGYFKLLNYVYSWLPPKFQSAVSSDNFYNWLKHLTGSYEVLFEFKDGTKLVEYESISFGRMSQAKFSEYVKKQLTVIYEDVIRQICAEPDLIIENIEAEFEIFLEKL